MADISNGSDGGGSMSVRDIHWFVSHKRMNESPFLCPRL